MLWRPSFVRRRKWICLRIIYCLLTNFSGMFKFSRIGRLDILWSVDKLGCGLCGKHSTTVQIRIVSRLWFCRRLWIHEVNIGWTLVHFRKSHVRTNKSDVQETDFCFTQSYRSWGDFSRCRFTHWCYSRSRSLGFSDWSVSFLTKPTKPKM